MAVIHNTICTTHTISSKIALLIIDDVEHNFLMRFEKFCLVDRVNTYASTRVHSEKVRPLFGFKFRCWNSNILLY